MDEVARDSFGFTGWPEALTRFTVSAFEACRFRLFAFGARVLLFRDLIEQLRHCRPTLFLFRVDR
jgi:hypothetical protein